VAELLGLEVGQLVGVAGLLVLLVVGGGAAGWIWSCRLARDRQARSQLVANSYHSKHFSILTLIELLRVAYNPRILDSIT
jgi:hypothetical protein